MSTLIHAVLAGNLSIQLVVLAVVFAERSRMHERDVLSLHMLPFVAEEARGKHVAMRRDEDVDWESLLLQ